eukprot:TRINITY_DN5305_c0_g1_i1.p1 TRINITY_DN5305_c0_g1~~TRINITY_DN5305_c0_g1_i1.p1  ORF type:complete len:114 (-),score=22.34 TRINITY_DN5305_c0_g1_i1:204-545(-)
MQDVECSRIFFFFFSSRRRHTRSCLVSWARRCVQETGYPQQIRYGRQYCDGKYYYKNIILPEEIHKKLPKNKFLAESEIKALGIKISSGWQHFEMYKYESHILMLRKLMEDQA